MTKCYDGRSARWASFSLVLILAISSCCAACGAAYETTNEDNTALVPTTRDKQIAINFTRLLKARHVSKMPLDEKISQRGFELFLKAIDPTKLYFNQQDVDEFTKEYATSIAQQASKGVLTPAFVIYNRYLTRVDERCAIADELLAANKFDFTVDEEFLRDNDAATYPKTPEEVRDRMRKRVKFELLALEAEERDKKKEAQEKAEGNAQTEAPAAPVASDRPDDPVSKLTRRYHTLQKRLHQTSNDDLLEIYLTAISNAFDPHSTYMSPKSFENFMIQIGLNLEGIGATLQWDDGYTVVKRIVKGSPAEKQGELKEEDKIVAVGQGVDGPMEDVVDMKLTDVVDKIRGKGGTIVRLDVVSPDGKKKQISIVREKVDLEDSAAQSAIFDVKGKGEFVDVPKNEGAKKEGLRVGVIDLPSFYLDMKAKDGEGGRSVSADVRQILAEFKANDVDACVVDLRYNGGGSLPEAVALTGLFIKTGAVVQTKPSEFGDRPRSLNDPDPSIQWTKPLVVLTSRLSASASEIFAGAIKDYRRGVIVGDETTHGKGSVQSMMEISDAIFGKLLSRGSDNLGSLKITIQGYYLPGGESPQLQGVRSDVVLPQFTSVLEDIAESDLDYPLVFEKVEPAKYPVFDFVTPEIVKAISAKSAARVANSKDFAEELDKMKIYKESKLRKATPLNREKYFAELDKLDTNKEETEKMEESVLGGEGVKRDYYLDECLEIAKDYCEALMAKSAI
ncbi:MAG: carboxy terminal-processing peptidase [Planctomycetia bacterium]|nr:carboxy terminal-processing peptidase [Planctomycetia bacterium]